VSDHGPRGMIAAPSEPVVAAQAAAAGERGAQNSAYRFPAALFTSPHIVVTLPLFVPIP
jgi:hypothetical protein